MAATNLDTELREQLLALLKGGQAHATLDEAIHNLPADKRGTVPEGLPYSIWQLLEHIRIAQRDILDFSTNQDGHYKEMNWPEDYWPSDAAPPSDHAWKESIAAHTKDLAALEVLAQKGDLITPFPWGDGQNLLREILLVADHVAYHTGEIIAVRRMLGVWK